MVTANKASAAYTASQPMQRPLMRNIPEEHSAQRSPACSAAQMLFPTQAEGGSQGQAAGHTARYFCEAALHRRVGTASCVTNQPGAATGFAIKLAGQVKPWGKNPCLFSLASSVSRGWTMEEFAKVALCVVLNTQGVHDSPVVPKYPAAQIPLSVAVTVALSVGSAVSGAVGAPDKSVGVPTLGAPVLMRDGEWDGDVVEKLLDGALLEGDGDRVGKLSGTPEGKIDDTLVGSADGLKDGDTDGHTLEADNVGCAVSAKLATTVGKVVSAGNLTGRSDVGTPVG